MMREIRLGSGGRRERARRPRARGRDRAHRGTPVRNRFSRRSHRSTLARALSGPLGGPSQRMPRSVGPSRQSLPRPHEIRMPSPAKGRTMRPAASKAAAIASVSASGGEPHEVALRLGDAPSARAQARRRAGRAARRSRAPARAAPPPASRLASAASSACAVTDSGMLVLRAASRMRGWPIGVADAQPCEPVRLGERAQHDDVRVTARRRARRRPSTASGSVTNSAYASSRMTSTSDGTASTNASNSACVTIGPVGLLGLHTMMARVRSVIAAAIAGRSCRASAVSGTCDGRRPGDDGEPGIRLERSPRVDDLVAWSGGREHELGEDRHAARADVHRVVVDAEAVGEALAADERPWHPDIG